MNEPAAPIRTVATPARNNNQFGSKPVRQIMLTPASGFIHLFALNALAIGQPMLHRLQSNAAFLQIEDLHFPAVLCSVLILMAGIPVGLTLMQLVVRRMIGAPAAGRLHQLQVLMMLFLLILSVFMTASKTLGLTLYGIYDPMLAPAAAVSAFILTRVYCVRSWLKDLLRLAAFGSLIFPLLFFRSGPVRSILFAEPPSAAIPERTAGSPVPVVFIVFDGLGGMSLLNEHHLIDPERYPSFARLAATSTWYRNASTVQYRTSAALPALLTGCLFSDGRGSMESEYPENLLRAVYQTQQYSMTVFEPFTQMCPQELRPQTRYRSFVNETGTLLQALSAVWVNVSFSRDLVPWMNIPATWFGFARSADASRQAVNGLCTYPWDRERRQQVEHFLRCLEPADHPSFRFLHLVAPHDPWNYLPSGNEYLWGASSYEFPLGSTGQNAEEWGPDELAVHRCWQLHLLQLQCVDRWLGQLLDRLQETGQLDESLLIVTADHGMAFVKEMNRRVPAAETLADLIPVPLLIKLPQQKQGIISDQNVETIDVYPTIADVIGLELATPVDGSSLLNLQGHVRPRKTVAGPAGEIVIDPDFKRKFDAVDRMLAVFGSGSQNDRLLQLNTRPHLIGRSIADFRSADRGFTAVRLKKGGDTVHPDRPWQIPCYLEGEISAGPEHDPASPIELAIALNGIIHATTRTFTDPDISRCWSCLLPESAYRAGENQLQVFEIVVSDKGESLAELPVSISSELPQGETD